MDEQTDEQMNITIYYALLMYFIGTKFQIIILYSFTNIIMRNIQRGIIPSKLKVGLWF